MYCWGRCCCCCSRFFFIGAGNLQDRAVDQAMAPPTPVPSAATVLSQTANIYANKQAQEFRDQGFVQVGGLCSTAEDRVALSQLGLELSGQDAHAAETAVLETACGATLLRALEQDQLCQLLAAIVGTDVQAIALRTQATAAAGAMQSPCREYCRSEPQLRTHGAFAHPFLSSDVKMVLPLSSSGATIDVIPGSQRWVEGSGNEFDGNGSVACKIELGSALLVDMRTWRSYANKQPATGQFALEVHYSKVSNFRKFATELAVCSPTLLPASTWSHTRARTDDVHGCLGFG